MLPDRAPDEDVDPGAVRNGRLVVAAEWVGVLVSHGPEGDAVHFVPGGRVHAYDAATGLSLCGADVRSLELFGMDFWQESTGLRCDQCLRVAAPLTTGARVDGDVFDA